MHSVGRGDLGKLPQPWGVCLIWFLAFSDWHKTLANTSKGHSLPLPDVCVRSFLPVFTLINLVTQKLWWSSLASGHEAKSVLGDQESSIVHRKLSSYEKYYICHIQMPQQCQTWWLKFWFYWLLQKWPCYSATRKNEVMLTSNTDLRLSHKNTVGEKDKQPRHQLFCGIWHDMNVSMKQNRCRHREWILVAKGRGVEWG